MKRKYVHIFVSLLCAAGVTAAGRDTVFVSGGIQHEGLMDWTPVMYHSNSYFDFAVNWQTASLENKSSFRGLVARTRLEFTQWPMPGYEAGFGGYGMSHLSLAANFTWGEITVGDVYGQFGSGLVLSLYEDRALGIDGTLRGAKIAAMPYRGIRITALGGKQRRYWECYQDKAFGWNYGKDAAIGGDVEVDLFEVIKSDKITNDLRWTVGGSYVSKYEESDTVITPIGGALYMYNLPRWVGAGDVRTEILYKGLRFLAEYARKANDPSMENGFSYRDGEALLLSASYSQKGLAILAQVKRSDNLSFRTQRLRTGIAGRLNHLPPFAQQHTYSLATLYPYATQYAGGEWAFQAEVRYMFAKKTKMGGRYGTSLKFSASHIRGLESPGSWRIDTRKEGEYYTDLNIELNKRATKRWWINAMLMYQTYNRQLLEGHGELVRSGIAVLDTRVQVTKNVAMRGELQYLYTPHYQGQWVFALYELSLYRHLTLSGLWLYNIGHSAEATNEHYFIANATFTYGAHRVVAGYTRTREGYNCSGGVCRFAPRMEGVTLNYAFTF